VTILRPTTKRPADEWARQNRVFPLSSGRPGPKDPALTPYMIPFMRGFEQAQYNTVVFVCGGQMGKTDSVIDVVLSRLDQRPVPVIYAGPDRNFVTDQFEPRFDDALNRSPSLAAKLARGKKNKKTRKIVSGVPVRLAWAGSANQLKSDPAGLAIVDERDGMARNIKGEGDPVRLLEVRGDTHADFRLGVTSTPTEGVVEVEEDEASGLAFWKVVQQDDIAGLESPIWKLWQRGTRYHWAWPCPHCTDYFVPRFKCLVIPKIDLTPNGATERIERAATPIEARRLAHIECPRCGGVIEETHKFEMNARGVYVAPGQRVDRNGNVTGTPPASATISFWVSGLASPFVSFGERAGRYVEALNSGDPEEVQTVINGGFGELWAAGGGDAPEWAEVARKAIEAGYKKGELPAGVVYLTTAVDVQKNRLIYVIRGWGARATSWLIDCGTLFGETIEEGVWTELADLITAPVCGLPIKLTFIDSGFRPGKPADLPLNRIYEFCRRFPRSVRATKGSSSPMRVPLVVSRHEVTTAGKANKYGLELVRLDTDHWKSWVHERVRWPSDQPGAWHLPLDIPDDYCMQIVSEARARTPSGKPKWVQRSRENHFLDCEAMQAAAGYLLNMQRMTPDLATRLIGQRKPASARAPQTRSPPETVAPVAAAVQAQAQARKPTLKGLAQLNRPRF
jgi:phage terminase large subunit GpA-like protein